MGRQVIYHCGEVKGFCSCRTNYPDQDQVLADMANTYHSRGYDDLIAIAEFLLAWRRSGCRHRPAFIRRDEACRGYVIDNWMGTSTL
jgi:hypothetical protein